jgi:hypothetical protein
VAIIPKPVEHILGQILHVAWRNNLKNCFTTFCDWPDNGGRASISPSFGGILWPLTHFSQNCDARHYLNHRTVPKSIFEQDDPAEFGAQNQSSRERHGWPPHRQDRFKMAV